MPKSLIKQMSHPRPLFHLFSVFSNKYYNFTTNIFEKMSIQFTVLWFEPPTFRTWVSAHITTRPGLPPKDAPLVCTSQSRGNKKGGKKHFWVTILFCFLLRPVYRRGGVAAVLLPYVRQLEIAAAAAAAL